VKADPGSPSARAINEIARVAARWQPPSGARGNVEFFVERMINRSVPA
jgi:flagellar biosynthesis protein FlhG